MDGLWIYVPVLAALAVFAIIRLSKAGPRPAAQGSADPGRGTPDNPAEPAVPAALMTRFMCALPDPGVRRRLIARERKRFPSETETGLVERVLFTLERDRT